MSAWGWRPARMQGIWQHGALWLRPLTLVAPWASLLFCLLTLYVVGDTLTMAEGVLFELPDAGLSDAAQTSQVAMIMPLKNETTVFFDDARYILEDGASIASLRAHLAERFANAPTKTLLVLADRRVSGGELSDFAAVARLGGVERILFANKRERGE